MEEESESSSPQLVLIPWPVMGHVQIVEFAKLIIHRQNLLPPGTTLSVTVLLMKLPDYIDTVTGSFTDVLSNSSATTSDGGPKVNFFHLPSTDPSPEWSSRTRGYFIYNLVLSQKRNVADFLRRSRGPKIAGVVVDMLCTSMIEVAEEFSLPAYVFFTSPASFLGAMLHCQTLHDEKNQDVAELRNSDSDLSIPSFTERVPPSVLPLVLVDKLMWVGRFLQHARDYRKAKGIIINTFTELETHALNSFLIDSAYGGGRAIPPVYPIGPILNPGLSLDKSSSDLLQWLDKQPPDSVLFICFGSQGSLKEVQIQQLAAALEQSKTRFLWSLRRQSPETHSASFPSEYSSYGEVLPDGFLERTADIGKVVGWVPQLAVLSHPAVGGFVSHCGWNSVLESLWCGVPIATWPLHAEQQTNAFQLVTELRLAVEITMRSGDGEGVLPAEVIERSIRAVMESGSEVRERVREMKEKNGGSVTEGGSSYISFKRLIDHMIISNVVSN